MVKGSYKVMRSFTLDPETAEMLSNSDNASSLINKLVRNHYEYDTSDNPDILIKKKLDLEQEGEIINKKLEHIKDKLILINQKQRREIKKKEKSKELIEYNKKAEDLKLRWIRGEFNTGVLDEEGNDTGDKIYFAEVDKLRLEKPTDKEDFTQEKEVKPSVKDGETYTK